MANDHGKGESSKAKGKSYARVAYDYSKDDVSKVKKIRKSSKRHHCGLATIDESPKEVAKVKSSRGSSKSQIGTHGKWISGGYYLGV